MKVKRLEVDELDVLIGAKVRQIRLARSIPQTQLAERLDLTYQQVQKYEAGLNRISVSALMKMSYVMDVPVMTFFAGLPDRDTKKIWPEVNLEIEDLKARMNLLDPKLIGPIRHLVDMIIESQEKSQGKK